jgi:hypothetical protein
MTTIDPTDEDAEEEMEEAILEKKRSETKYGHKVEPDND